MFFYQKSKFTEVQEYNFLGNTIGTVLTTILPILFLYLNTVTVTAGTFEP